MGAGAPLGHLAWCPKALLPPLRHTQRPTLGGFPECGKMTVGTAVTTKCLVAQETAGWGEGGGARQLVLHNARSTNIISPKLGRAARNWNCSLGNTTPSTCSPSDQSAPFGKGR